MCQLPRTIACLHRQEEQNLRNYAPEYREGGTTPSYGDIVHRPGSLNKELSARSPPSSVAEIFATPPIEESALCEDMIMPGPSGSRRSCIPVFHTQVIYSHFVPEDAILRLCVDNDTVEVEKNGDVFCFSHINFLLPYNVNTLSITIQRSE